MKQTPCGEVVTFITPALYWHYASIYPSGSPDERAWNEHQPKNGINLKTHLFSITDPD